MCVVGDERERERERESIVTYFLVIVFFIRFFHSSKMITIISLVTSVTLVTPIVGILVLETKHDPTQHKIVPMGNKLLY